MTNRTLTMTFENCDSAQANILAQELEQAIHEAQTGAEVSLKRANPTAQDFGSTLVLVFGTPVAIALADAIATFLKRNSGAEITITESGKVTAKNLESRDAARIAEVFSKQVTT